MKHTLKTHREYIEISNQNKPIEAMTNYELQIVKCETPSITKLFAIEAEMQKRGLIAKTFQQTFLDMTGGNIVST